MISLPSGSEAVTEGKSDDKPIVLQDVKSIDFECMLWMFYNELVSSTPLHILGKGCSSSWNRKYFDYTASAGEWSAIISLAHMWQFENMSQAAFKAYAALPNVSPIDKISMSQKYDIPKKDLADVYLEICTRDHPVSVEEGDQIGVGVLALLIQTREELQTKWGSWPTNILKQVVNHNLIELKPSFKFKREGLTS
jgi:hypothetical protein